MADWQGFYSFNDTNTIHLRGRVGALFQNTDENIPVFERFYVGGMDTVRGYSYSDASPRSTDPVTIATSSAATTWCWQLRIRLDLPEGYGARARTLL